MQLQFTCKHCGRGFIATYRTAQFCSLACQRHGRKRTPLDERFWAKVNKTDTCWLWTGALIGKGYGKIGVGGKYGGHFYVHRFSWALHYGPIPDGMAICHHCDTRLCVRPDHLFLGTTADNIHDMDKKGRRRTWKPDMARDQTGRWLPRAS